MFTRVRCLLPASLCLALMLAAVMRLPPPLPAEGAAMRAGPPQRLSVLGDDETRLGVAVVGLDGETELLYNAYEPFALASVAKLYILAAVLDRLAKVEQPLSPGDRAALEDMVQWSDNDAAESFWERLGSTGGLQAYLLERGLPGLVPAVDDAWGDARQSALGLAEFLVALASGRLLEPEATALSMTLLAGVDEDQAWGVSAGVTAVDPAAEVMIKNGWYPAEDGWRINSAGIVKPGNGSEAYVIVILGSGFADREEAIALVERLASVFNAMMLA